MKYLVALYVLLLAACSNEKTCAFPPLGAHFYPHTEDGEKWDENKLREWNAHITQLDRENRRRELQEYERCLASGGRPVPPPPAIAHQ